MGNSGSSTITTFRNVTSSRVMYKSIPYMQKQSKLILCKPQMNDCNKNANLSSKRKYFKIDWKRPRDIAFPNILGGFLLVALILQLLPLSGRIPIKSHFACSLMMWSDFAFSSCRACWWFSALCWVVNC